MSKFKIFSENTLGFNMNFEKFKLLHVKILVFSFKKLKKVEFWYILEFKHLIVSRKSFSKSDFEVSGLAISEKMIDVKTSDAKKERETKHSSELYYYVNQKQKGTKYSLFKIVIYVNKTLIISHFLCQSTSHYVITSSTKNDPNLQRKCRRIYQSFRSHFWGVKVNLFRKRAVSMNSAQFVREQSID